MPQRQGAGEPTCAGHSGRPKNLHRRGRNGLDRTHGRADLADVVRWTSREDGDGLGYDVLSFCLDGRERYIEVKATALTDVTPFYISSAELDFAQRNVGRYALCRVYDVDRDPRFFVLEGDITEVLGLTPVSYSARITPVARMPC